LAVLSLYRLGGLLGLPQGLRLGWVASFGLATVALTYTRHVNNHVLLLGVVAAACVQLVCLAGEAEAGHVSRVRLLGLGALVRGGLHPAPGGGPAAAGRDARPYRLPVSKAAPRAGLPAVRLPLGGRLPRLQLRHRRRLEADEHGAGILGLARVPVHSGEH